MAWTTPAASGPLDYPNRHYGNDHDRYSWSMLTDRAPITWPQGDGLALFVVVPLQFFPLNPQGKPVKVAGNMTMPYPDLRHYTLRDYGNRVGIHRVLKALDAASVKPTFAVNTRLFEREPLLRDQIVGRGDEIIAHSWSMDTVHAGGLDEADERELVQRSVNGLRELTGQAVRGWLSPGKLNSPNTPDLIAEAGIEYFCDWVNDEVPYRWNVASGELWSMPLATEISDTFTLVDNLHSEGSWADQVCDAADLLHAEAAEQGGRILTLTLTPWLLGQPHRMKHLERVLDHVTGLSGVWSASGSQILDAAKPQITTA
jgi:peptidoglycan/xylan/chitin deacetylase (PgdA/CDA1 family)